MNEIKKKIQDWILCEEKAGRSVDIDRINQYASLLISRHNNSPRDDFNGLSPYEMDQIIYHPFSEQCVVGLYRLGKEEYEKIPLVRQALFLLNTLNEKELKLTKLGWLPLKIVAEAYPLGQPEWILEVTGQKRINEYDAKSVWMARIIIELLGWVKTRKGMLSLTVKGKKALSDIDNAANEILRFSLVGVGLQTFDLVQDDTIGNFAIPYSVWLLNKYGSKWHFGSFYQEQYQKAFNLPNINEYNIYETRVFERLFYWLGIVELRYRKPEGHMFHEWEYRKSALLPMIFSFKKP